MISFLYCYNLILYTYFQVKQSCTSYTHIPIYIYRHAELYSYLHLSVFYLNTVICMHLSSCKLDLVYILLSSYLHTQPRPYLSMNFPTILSFNHGTCPALWKDSTRSRAWIASYAANPRKMWGRWWRTRSSGKVGTSFFHDLPTFKNPVVSVEKFIFFFPNHQNVWVMANHKRLWNSINAINTVSVSITLSWILKWQQTFESSTSFWISQASECNRA